MTDDQILEKAIELNKQPPPVFYKIHYRTEDGRTGCYQGEFSEAHKDIWLKYFGKPNNGLGCEYWAVAIEEK
jgi:hypothetical protein